MSSKGNVKKTKTNKKRPVKRTPRTITVDDTQTQLPALMPESFSRLKNFDFVGKIDDMRVLTKELSVMARQLEQWMGVIYTVGLAFKDNGVLKDVLRAVSSIGGGEGTSAKTEEQSRGSAPREQSRSPFPPPFPFSFLGGDRNEQQQRPSQYENYRNEDTERSREDSQPKNPLEGLNIMEIIGNPAFQEIVSKLFLQKK